MGRLGLAFRILFNGQVAEKVRQAMESPGALPAPAETQAAPKPSPPPKPAKPKRSEALTFLASLQREARFVDFLQEPIDGYSDAQVGAAVRQIHKGCREVLQRVFSPEPIVAAEDGSVVNVEDPTSAAYRLTGNVAQAAGGDVAGKLQHHGWKATRSAVPEWQGDDSTANVIAPAEVEVS